jgi:hypothetical protein
VKWTGHAARLVEETCIKKFRLENLKGIDHVKDVDRHWGDNIKIDFKQDARVWTKFIWLRLSTSCGLL